MSELMFHLLIFDSLYYKYLVEYLISIDGKAVLSYYGITRPESDLIY